MQQLTLWIFASLVWAWPQDFKAL